MKPIVLDGLWCKHKTRLVVSVLAVLLFALSGCGSTESAVPTTVPAVPAENTVIEPTETPASAIPADPLESQEGSETEMQDAEVEKTMTLLINGQEISVDWEENDSVEALRKLCAEHPLVIEMSLYGGFEQVGSIGQSLPRNDSQTTTQPGDIVLYSGNQIVIFFGSNSWAYTRLGRVSDQEASGMTDLLGNGNVTLTVSSDD